ncbi:hypothetical protein [Nocardia sp. NPDC004722]
MPDGVDDARAELKAALILAVMKQKKLTMAEATEAVRFLRWRDFDLDKGTFRVPRLVPELSAETLAALRRHAQ